MKSQEELNSYKEMSKLMRKMADYLDELVELDGQEESEEREAKEEEILGKYLVVAVKLQQLSK